MKGLPQNPPVEMAGLWISLSLFPPPPHSLIHSHTYTHTRTRARLTFLLEASLNYTHISQGLPRPLLLIIALNLVCLYSQHLCFSSLNLSSHHHSLIFMLSSSKKQTASFVFVLMIFFITGTDELMLTVGLYLLVVGLQTH